MAARHADELEITVKYILEGGARRPDSIAVTYDDRWKLLTTEKSLNAKNASLAPPGNTSFAFQFQPNPPTARKYHCAGD